MCRHSDLPQSQTEKKKPIRFTKRHEAVGDFHVTCTRPHPREHTVLQDAELEARPSALCWRHRPAALSSLLCSNHFIFMSAWILSFQILCCPRLPPIFFSSAPATRTKFWLCTKCATRKKTPAGANQTPSPTLLVLLFPFTKPFAILC